MRSGVCPASLQFENCSIVSIINFFRDCGQINFFRDCGLNAIYCFSDSTDKKNIDYLNLFSSWALFGISLFEKKNVVGDNGGEP